MERTARARTRLLWVVLTAGGWTCVQAANHPAGMNSIGATPPMGWNSWNHFGRRLSEVVVKSTADALVSSGLAAKGFTYVNMDDSWAGGRDNTTGKLFADRVKFPSQIPELAKYVHDKGLSFGIYTDVGHQTCAKCPGTWGYEEIDANTFAEWGVDFVKSDSCFTSDNHTFQPAYGPNCMARYKLFDHFLKATNRPMIHSVKGPCGRGYECSPFDASSFANLRRTSGDARDNWASVMKILNDAANATRFSKPGFFADMDIMEIGNGGLSAVEERSEMTLWCALKSPLLLGNDIRNISSTTLMTVGNENLIAINQDRLGQAAERVQMTPDFQVWAGNLDKGDIVLVLLNTAQTKISVASEWSAIKEAVSLPNCSAVFATELWTNRTSNYSLNGNAPSASLLSHEAAAFRLTCKAI